MFADALLSEEDISTVARNVAKPLAVNMGFGIRQSGRRRRCSRRGELEDMGVAVVTYPRILTAAAIKGMQNALDVLGQSLREERVIDRPDLLVSFDEINTLMGLPGLRELEARHLSAEDKERKYGRAAQ